MTFSPKHNQRCRLLTHTALGKPENTRGKGGQAPDLAPRGTRGYYNKHPRFWWKKVLWKHYLFKKKKSRNCIELRKWHDIITYFCPSEPPPRSSVWFLHASSRKRLYYNIIWQIQLNLHFQRRLRSPQAARTVRDAWANDQPPQEQGHKKQDPRICKKQTNQKYVWSSFMAHPLLPQRRDGQFPICVTAQPLANFICENLALAGVYLKCLYSWEFKSKWEPVREVINGFLNGFDEAWKSFCFWANRGGAESLPTYFWLGLWKSCKFATVVHFHTPTVSVTLETLPFNGCVYKYESLKVPGFYLGTTDPSFQESFCSGEEGKEQGTAEKQLKRGLNSQKKTAAAVPWRAWGGRPGHTGRLA